MTNICSNCKGMVVLHAFSYSECIYCRETVSTPHIPRYKCCNDCAEKNNVCQQCNSEL